MNFNFTAQDEANVIYLPWTDGRCVGFECVHPDGRTEYIYLNPSSDSDDDTSSVFVYQGEAGDASQDNAWVHFVVFG